MHTNAPFIHSFIRPVHPPTTHHTQPRHPPSRLLSMSSPMYRALLLLLTPLLMLAMVYLLACVGALGGARECRRVVPSRSPPLGLPPLCCQRARVSAAARGVGQGALWCGVWCVGMGECGLVGDCAWQGAEYVGRARAHAEPAKRGGGQPPKKVCKCLARCRLER